MQVTNAIAWAQFQLRGGWKNVLATSAVYFVLLGVVIVGTLRIDPTATAQVLTGWTMGLMALQIGTLILFGCWAVSAGVRKDITGSMIESHRLMPVSGAEAIVGYILGTASQAITLSVANLILGLLTVQGAAMGSPAGWLKANFVLWVFAGCAWVVVAFLPLVTPAGARGLVTVIFILGIGREGIPALAPGVSMLVGPAIQESVFGVILNNQITTGQQVSMLAQVLVAALCFIGAMRKYRRDDVLAWGPLLGLGVLAAYVAISVVGIAFWEDFQPRMWSSEHIAFEAQIILAALGALGVGLISVSAASWLHTQWGRRRELNDPAPNPRPIPVVLVVLAAALAGAALMPLAVILRWEAVSYLVGSQLVQEPRVGPQISGELMVQTFLVFFAFLLSMSYLLRFLYRRQIRARWIVTIFVALLWVVPPAFDFMVNGVMQDFSTEEVFTAASACSPPAALIYLWAPVDLPTNIGIAVQLAIAGLFALLHHSNARKPALSEEPPVPA